MVSFRDVLQLYIYDQLFQVLEMQTLKKYETRMIMSSSLNLLYYSSMYLE